MNKTIVFDMDGTIADFYSVKNWLTYLHNGDPYPYVVAKPIVDMDILNTLIAILKTLGWKVAITTWLAKDGNNDFNNKVRQAKIEWLKKHHFEYDEIHLVKYGTTKANCTRKNGGFQILVDDNEKIRTGWNLGSTINANGNIIKELADLIVEETKKIA